MNNQDFFLALIHRLRSYDDALVMAVLTALGAADRPMRSTITTISQMHLGGAMHRNAVHRAVERLVSKGLLSVRVHPNSWTEYTVLKDAVRDLLQQPAPSIPGLTNRPIQFLAQSEPVATPEGVAADVPRSPTPNTENLA